MKITQVTPFILHVPVSRSNIADSMHQLTHWGAPGVVIRTDSGLSGYGYTGTHAHLATDRLIADCIEHVYGPLLIGREINGVQPIWHDLFRHPPVQWVGRCGITHLALSAVDIALWDLEAKAAGVPLWKLLGRKLEPRAIEAYNTDGGWLNWPLDVLVADCKRLVEEEGFRGIKIKVGSPEPGRDLERIESVRRAIGPHVRFMVDANGRFDLPTATALGEQLTQFDIGWFEEPIWYDDVEGHARLARAIPTPIALGEQLYMPEDFANFIRAQAVHFVQADAVRLAGITQWWQVADLAHAHQLPVAPHIGDMMQVHLHLSLAHEACHMLEFIPWLRSCFEEPATVQDGHFVVPQLPGAGTTLLPNAITRFKVR